MLIKLLRSLLNDIPPETIIYHGHGEPRRAGVLIPQQMEDIETVRDLVADALDDGEVTPTEQEQIISQLEEKYSDYETSLVLPDLRIANINGIAEELQQNKFEASIERSPI